MSAMSVLFSLFLKFPNFHELEKSEKRKPICYWRTMQPIYCTFIALAVWAFLLFKFLVRSQNEFDVFFFLYNEAVKRERKIQQLKTLEIR